MGKICFIVILLSLTGIFNVESYAQDVRFTQYFASPLNVNPANTGAFGGGTRISSNFRDQWWNVGTPYRTYSISVDATVMSDLHPNAIGVGFMAIRDESLAGALQSHYFSGSVAYHKSLDGTGKMQISGGFQLTYTDKTVDFNKLTFASQYNGTGFDSSLPADFIYSSNGSKHVDISGGLLYSVGRDDDPVKFYTGFSMYHLLQPEESVFSEASSRVRRRATINSGAEFRISDFSAIILSGLYSRQQNAEEKIAGVAYSYLTSISDTRLYGGLWYSFAESYTPYIGINFKNIMVGANYSISSNQILSYRPRSTEFSITYTLRSIRSVGRNCYF